MADTRLAQVPDGLAGERVDAALARMFGLSRSKAAALAEAGDVHLDGVTAGKSARVESGDANGKTVYRVRMGPYGTATELAEAKQKLGNGGLPALAIKAN